MLITPYEYYMNHFILLKDIEQLYKMNRNELYQNEEQKSIIYKIERERSKILQDNILLLFQLSKVLNKILTYQNSKEEFTKFRLEDELEELIKGKITLTDLCRQKSYLEKFIRSMQFTGLYLYQENYDTKVLVALFDIKSTNTVMQYLYHPLTKQLLDIEIQQYMKEKRAISENQRRYQNYQNLIRDEKGQFVKKYQASEAIK